MFTSSSNSPRFNKILPDSPRSKSPIISRTVLIIPDIDDIYIPPEYVLYSPTVKAEIYQEIIQDTNNEENIIENNNNDRDDREEREDDNQDDNDREEREDDNQDDNDREEREENNNKEDDREEREENNNKEDDREEREENNNEEDDREEREENNNEENDGDNEEKDNGDNNDEDYDGYDFEPNFIEYENHSSSNSEEEMDKSNMNKTRSKSEDYKILWTNESINSLRKIMEVINNHKLMKPIGYLVKYYINNHQPRDIEYRIVTVDGTNNNISRDVMILACICEIRLRKKYKKTKIISEDLAYRSFGRVIYEVIDSLYRYNQWDLGFGEIYIINELNDILADMYDKTIDSRHIITVSYYITKQIMNLEQRGKIIQFMDTLIIRCEDMDLTFMTKNQIRNIMTILKTKRKIYVKIWLIISEYLLRSKMPICQNFVYDITTLRHNQDFKDFMYDPIVDILITVSASMILINPES